MEFSVIIPVHNQRERLRLVLCALRNQTFPSSRFEVIVVDDGSTDDTACMLASMRAEPYAFKIVDTVHNVGRCKARNLGVSEASGKFVAFLDGDALPHPMWLEAMSQGFAQRGANSLLCGFKRSLPDLELLQDPQTGQPLDIDMPSVLKEYIRINADDMILREDMLTYDFAQIDQRSVDGGYPMPELKLMQEQTIELFRKEPDSPIGWIGHYPHNGATLKAAFERVGGYDEAIPFSEGWEIAYRLQQVGTHPYFVDDAKTYHLYHYHDQTTPEKALKANADRNTAIQYMAAKHRDPRFHLLRFWMASIWPSPFIPEEMLVYDLLEFHHRYVNTTDLDEMVRMVRNHPVWSESRAPELVA